MAGANPHSTPIPRLAELVRDPTTRESFRKMRHKGVFNVFVDGHPAKLRRRPSVKSIVMHDVVESGDVLGRDQAGNFFVLVTLSQQAFAWLCSHGAFDDREVDDEDCGEEERHGQVTGPGNDEDAEEDDPGEASAQPAVLRGSPHDDSGRTPA